MSEMTHAERGKQRPLIAPICDATGATTSLMQYSKVIEPLYKSIGERLNESRTLAALRDALLPKLLSGEIRVKDTLKEAVS